MFANSASSQQASNEFREGRTKTTSIIRKARKYTTTLYINGMTKNSFTPEFQAHFKAYWAASKHSDGTRNSPQEAEMVSLAFMGVTPALCIFRASVHS